MSHAIDAVVNARHSVRAFKNQAVSQELIREILSIASRAPSGTNTQPWKVYVVVGEVKAAIINQVCAVYDQIVANPEVAKQYKPAYDYYPTKWVSPYLERRRENGWGFYGLLGITRQDKDKMIAQQKKNYTFFGAPVGLFFTVPKELGTGSKMDIAMFMQNIMLLAKARGLDTCPQAAWNEYQTIVLPILKATEGEELLAAISLGYASSSDIVNSFITPRVAVEDFTVWQGF